MKKKVVILAVVVVVVIGLFGWQIWRRIEADRQAKDKARREKGAVAVEVGAIIRGPIRDVRLFTGTVDPRARYVVAPKVGGRLEKLAVKLGDAVAPGNLIAQLDDEEYRQQVAQSRATLEVAKATVEQQQTSVDLAERESERLRKLREREAASEAAWDTADAAYKIMAARHKVALAQMAEKEAALKADEVRLSYTRIILPTDANGAAGKWFVAERFVDEGAMLSANAPLIAVVDLAVVTVVIHVIERDYPSLKVGLGVELETDACPGERFTGKIIRIAPALEEGSRQGRVEIEVPNDKCSLRPGMFARVFIEFARREQATLLPRAALVRRNGQDGVFLVDEKKLTVRFVPVKLDIQATELFSVLDEGLSGLVVTLGHHLLSDGATVLLPGQNPAAADRQPKAAAPGKQP